MAPHAGVTRVAVVTGGGSGIGEATARRLAADGMVVMVVDVDAPAADRVAAEIQSDGRGGAWASAFDVRDGSAWEAAAAECMERHRRIDVLFNNAGIFRDARVSKMTDEQWNEVVDVCLKGAWLGAKAVFGAMVEQRYGRLIATSSTAHMGNFGQANYASAKGGLVSLARTLALEGAKHGITSNAVAPGSINTPAQLSMDDKFLDMYRERVPMKRFGEPHEVASLVSYLASEQASYVTGQLIHVCGGASVGA